ncbi:MAG: 16S rRNA (cytosine(1402)-N(4))-methyltransferase [Elusimicrobia bacterium GWF2_62_30]|nr:MAG: 16S rRNA (cytosine(1402)-N(4))-methyltransferase [Elusimicrobia bacterium GWF2_62_30]
MTENAGTGPSDGAEKNPAQEFTHIAVLAQEVVNLLVTGRKGTFVDATLGMGGHTARLLAALPADVSVLGIDWDPEMAAIAARNLAQFGPRVKIAQGNFANIDEITAREGISSLSGALFDLGISSLHFDKASRGFSIKHDGPLDMRINPDNPLTAYTIINQWPYEQIEHLIRICGERHSRRITKAILDTRRARALETTAELGALIARVVPAHGEKIHPATKTFLALRVAVNYEFDNITRGIQKIMPLLKPGARLGIITFHSLEDRIVKETFKMMASLGGWQPVTRKPVKPSEAELQENKRARSAKLRVIEKL